MATMPDPMRSALASKGARFVMASMLAFALASPALMVPRGAVAMSPVGAINTGGMPMGMAYDPTNGKLFIATADAVVVAEGTSIVDSIPCSWLMQFPCNLVFVQTVQQLYVANCGGEPANDVTVIDAYTDSIVGSVTLAQDPFGIAYDGHTNQVFAVDSSGTVSAIDVTNQKVVQALGIPSGYYDLLFDPNVTDGYAANFENGTVSVIGDQTYSIVATIPVGRYPMSMGLDSAAGRVFVANFADGTVSVINDRNNTVVNTIETGWMPTGVAVDQSSGVAYVANGARSSLMELSLSTYGVIGSVPTGMTMGTPLFVHEMGKIFIPCAAAGEVLVFVGGADPAPPPGVICDASCHRAHLS